MCHPTNKLQKSQADSAAIYHRLNNPSGRSTDDFMECIDCSTKIK